MERENIDERIDALCEVFLKMKSKEDCKMLLEDLCTYKEMEQMALRVHTAKMFLQGKTYVEIIEETHLSSATISRVSYLLNHGSGGYRTFIDANE